MGVWHSVLSKVKHYENAPMQYTEMFFGCKNENHQLIFFLYNFLIFAQNIYCGYTLEPPWRGGSNEYQQSMFWSNNKKNRYTPTYPSFANIKVGYKGVIFMSRTCFPDVITLLNQAAESPGDDQQPKTLNWDRKLQQNWRDLV